MIAAAAAAVAAAVVHSPVRWRPGPEAELAVAVAAGEPVAVAVEVAVAGVARGSPLAAAAGPAGSPPAAAAAVTAAVSAGGWLMSLCWICCLGYRLCWEQHCHLIGRNKVDDSGRNKISGGIEYLIGRDRGCL